MHMLWERQQLNDKTHFCSGFRHFLQPEDEKVEFSCSRCSIPPIAEYWMCAFLMRNKMDLVCRLLVRDVWFVCMYSGGAYKYAMN